MTGFLPCPPPTQISFPVNADQAELKSTVTGILKIRTPRQVLWSQTIAGRFYRLWVRVMTCLPQAGIVSKCGQKLSISGRDLGGGNFRGGSCGNSQEC